MKDVINILKKNNIQLKKMDALEVFGRGGDWHTVAYAKQVKSLEVWEINKAWKKHLKKNLPMAKIKILDSVKTILVKNNLRKFDLVIIDNPMNVFGSKIETNEPEYCEHFDFMKHINKIISDDSIIIFNINKQPFDYEKYPLWKKRRKEFYGKVNTSNMNRKFLLNFYKKLFKNIGYKTIFHFYIIRHKHLDYFVYRLKKINTDK